MKRKKEVANNTINLGTSIHGGDFTLKDEDRLRHLYIIGQTGTGKSSLLHNIILQDLYRGAGITVIDPHGDLIDEVLHHYPKWRSDDLVFLDATDRQWPVGFNLLEIARRTPGSSDRAVSAIVSAFKGVWGESWGPRLEYILSRSVATLLHSENTTLLSLQRMLVDDRYREQLLKQVDDPLLLSFWRREFGSWDKRFRAEAISPIQNKVGQLLGSQTLRNIVGQPRPRFTPRFLMDDRRVFFVNLSKGELGEDNASLLGAMIVSAVHLAAFSRANVRPEDRVEHHLIIDEFQNASTAAFASILSESRKYGLSLTLAHQYLKQVDEPILDAVFGNIGTVMALRAGEEDSQRIARAVGRFPASHYAQTANYRAILRRLEDGSPQEPEPCDLMKPLEWRTGRAGLLRMQSRRHYGVSADVVSNKIARWIE